MKDEYNREITQLWWIADEYFRLTDQVKKYLSDGDLQTTVEKLAKKCQHVSEITGTNALLMLLNAHLASCAVRLYSIDEKRRGCSKRWKIYKDLERKEDKLTVTEVNKTISSIVHFLLRHNVAHEEQFENKGSHLIVRAAFIKLTVGKLYQNMLQVKNNIKKDIASILQS